MPRKPKTPKISGPDPEHDEVTQQEFDDALVALVDEMSANEIIAIPGLYEVISEYLNNEAIDRAHEIRGQKDDE